MAEFQKITEPLIKKLWKEGYFTIPMPGKERKEFKLDMPAFKRFDIFAAKWENDQLKVLAVESKIRAAEGIPQARTYQLCIPEVYVASINEENNRELIEKFIKYGIGYIAVIKGSPQVLVEPRRSPFFNRKFYESEVVPRAITILGFYDFMSKCLGKDRDEILRDTDLGVEVNYLWISDRKSSEGIQWSMVYDGDTIRFGINLESVKAIENAFSKKSESHIKSLFNEIKQLPKNFRIKFERRCPEGEKFRRGMQHVPYTELGKSEKRVTELSDKDISFMAKKAKNDKYIEFGIWVDICKKEEIPSWNRNELWRKMEYYKTKYLDNFYNSLK